MAYHDPRARTGAAASSGPSSDSNGAGYGSLSRSTGLGGGGSSSNGGGSYPSAGAASGQQGLHPSPSPQHQQQYGQYDYPLYGGYEYGRNSSSSNTAGGPGPGTASSNNNTAPVSSSSMLANTNNSQAPDSTTAPTMQSSPTYPFYQQQQQQQTQQNGGGGPGGMPSASSSASASGHAAAGPSSSQVVSGQSGSGSVMAPLPEHIEAGIMASSTWLLQPDGEYQVSFPEIGTSGDIASNNSATQPQPFQQPSDLRTSPTASSHLSHTPLPIHQQQHPKAYTFASSFTPSAAPTIQNTEPLIVSDADDISGWRLAIESTPFTSGLEGISGLPLQVYHATTALGAAPPPPFPANMRHATEWPPSKMAPYDKEVEQLTLYVNELINLLADFAVTPENPTPAPPPPYLHTRVSRYATLVRETLASLESRSQPYLDPTFVQPPPSREMSEAEREMDLIRARREVLRDKALQAKRDIATGGGAPGSRPRQSLPPPGVMQQQGYPSDQRTGPRPAPLSSRPQHEIWHCQSCRTTQASEWNDGPGGPRSLCDQCYFHNEQLRRKRDGGDGDFSSIPAGPRYSHTPSMMSMGPT